MEKPSISIKKNVPTNETGTAIAGIKVERKSCKNIYTLSLIHICGRRTNSCIKKGVCVSANTQLNIRDTPITTTNEDNSSPVICGE